MIDDNKSIFEVFLTATVVDAVKDIQRYHITVFPCPHSLKAEPGTRPVTRKDLLKKDLRKVILKHQLVSNTTSSISTYQGRRAEPRDLERRQRDALVKKIFQSAIL